MASKKTTKVVIAPIDGAPFVSLFPSGTLSAVLETWAHAQRDMSPAVVLQMPAIHLGIAVLRRHPRAFRELVPGLALLAPEDSIADVIARAADGASPVPLLAATLQGVTAASCAVPSSMLGPGTSLLMVRKGPWQAMLEMAAKDACHLLRAGPCDLQMRLEYAAMSNNVSCLAALERLASLTQAATFEAPDIVDDDFGFLPERRALLRLAMQMAPPSPLAEFVGRTYSDVQVDQQGLLVTISSRYRGRTEARFDAIRGCVFLDFGFSDPAPVWSWLRDVVSAPTPAERPMLVRWFERHSEAVLEALDEYANTVEATAQQERLVWELAQRASRILVGARRQKRMKRGWSRGVAIDISRIRQNSSASERDRSVALAVDSGAIGRALTLLQGMPVVDELGRPIDVVLEPLMPEIVEFDGRRQLQLRLGDVTTTDIPADDWMVRVEQHNERARWHVGIVEPRLKHLLQALPPSLAVPSTPRAEQVLHRLAEGSAAGSVPIVLPASLQGEVLSSTPRLVLRLALTDPLQLSLAVMVVCGEGAAPQSPGSGIELLPALLAGHRVRYARRLADEVELAEPVFAVLASEGVQARFEDNDRWSFSVSDDDALTVLQRANDSGVEVVWRDQRQLTLAGTVKAQQLRLRVSTARQWLGIEGEAVVDAATLSLATLLAASREHRRFIRIGTDRFIALDRALRDRLERVAALTHDDDTSGPIEAPFAVAHALAALSDEGVQFEEGAVWRQIGERLDRVRSVDDNAPAGLCAELRHYQREGLIFLRRLAAFGTGGVLADDMGLGKTVQAIGLLVDRAADETLRGAALVVVPTSLVFNWQRELARFAPSLRVHIYGDAPDRRALLDSVGAGDVVVVSYGLIDSDSFADVHFATVVFDEAQAIKNAETLRARACRDLDADLKIALSGTPLENHLGELWSLFSIVTPGLLGSQSTFRKRFLLPIERERSVQHRRRLGETLRPFLLRRTRGQVLSDLPALTEQLVEIAAGDDERQLYEALRVEIVNELDAGGGDQRFKVLAGLTRLRLACCHPQLVEPQWRGSAAKLDEAVAIVSRAREAGQRVLVFSQFVKFLDIVEPALQAVGVRTLRLDGSTPEPVRRERVDAFQQGKADVFVLSLKAGGAGLNLTVADVVVHLDPWWNPAVEAQAVARAHRMGRTAPVTSIRLAMHDTIEAEILKLHDSKRELVDAVLEGAGAGTSLGIEELTMLLRGS